MELTHAQETTLKAHLAANTNSATLPDATTFVINANLAGRDPTKQQAIADWYNQLALATDAQAPANLMLWNPRVTIAQINSAIVWTDDPAGSDEPTRTNSWMRWQSMTWNQNQGIDMTDAQVRAGVVKVWGNPSASATNLGKATGVLTGKLDGRRIDLALAGGVVGAVSGVWAAAHVCPANVLGQLLTQPDVDEALLNG